MMLTSAMVVDKGVTMMVVIAAMVVDRGVPLQYGGLCRDNRRDDGGQGCRHGHGLALLISHAKYAKSMAIRRVTARASIKMILMMMVIVMRRAPKLPPMELTPTGTPAWVLWTTS
jgi:hypothetical protein